jgi:hypothetical protein
MVTVIARYAVAQWDIRFQRSNPKGGNRPQYIGGVLVADFK